MTISAHNITLINLGLYGFDRIPTRDQLTYRLILAKPMVKFQNKRV